MTPTVLTALVDSMSPQELINSLGSLKRRGALDNPEIKSLVDDKLAEAKDAERVSAFKAEKAIEAAGVSDDVRRKLEKVADTQVKAKGRIRRPTALLVDKSASMHAAIELGKRIGAMISAICEEKLYVYAFDTMAYEVAPRGTDLADWERAFSGIQAGGCTSCGVPLAYMQRQGQYAEQIVMITDEGENTAPRFLDALRQYREAVNADPSVCIVRTPGGGSHLERQCYENGIVLDLFEFKGDYYSLPNLIPLLSRPSRMELLMEIMGYPLPERRCA